VTAQVRYEEWNALYPTRAGTRADQASTPVTLRHADAMSAGNGATKDKA
jgi:hypothetical protein